MLETRKVEILQIKKDWKRIKSMPTDVLARKLNISWKGAQAIQNELKHAEENT